MRIIKRIFIISFLILLLIYVTNITSIPSNIILFQGETIKINTAFGINIKSKNEENYETIQASTDISSNVKTIGKKNYTLNLFGGIALKDITVNVIPKTSVVPVRKRYRT